MPTRGTRPSRASRIAPFLIAVAILAAVTAIQVLPAPQHLGDRFATNPGDPAFLMWQLDTQVHHPSALLSGNIFWPHTDALAYSDPLILYVPLVAPVLAVTGGNIVAAYNFLVFVGYLAGALAVYALALRLLRSHPGALTAALLFTIAPYRGGALAHVQLVAVALLPLALLAVIALVERPRMRTAVGLGLAAGLCWLGALYIFEMMLLSLAAFVLAWGAVRRGRVGRAVPLHLAVSAAVAAVVIAPTLPAYLRVHNSGLITRSAAELLSARPGGFTHPPPSPLYRLAGVTAQPTDVDGLFPGATLLLLVALVAVLVVRHRHRPSPLPGSLRTHAIPLIAVGVVTALVLPGPRHTLPVSAGYRMLAALVPGMRDLRDLTRFWMVPLVLLALVAGAGVTMLVARLGPRRGWAFTAVVLVIGGLELSYRPMFTGVTTSSTADAALTALPPAPVMELPLPPPDTIAYALTVAPRMLRSVADGLPRVEGYSGAIPPDVLVAVESARHVPDPAALAALRAHGVRYLLLHGSVVACAGAYGPDELGALVTRLAADTADVERVITPAVGDPVAVLRPADAASPAPRAAADDPTPATPRPAVGLCAEGS